MPKISSNFVHDTAYLRGVFCRILGNIVRTMQKQCKKITGSELLNAEIRTRFIIITLQILHQFGNGFFEQALDIF